MKRMLLLALALGMLLLASGAAAGEITIKGVITNLKAASVYIDKQSYLQLVRLPRDNQLGGVYEHGRIYYHSDLAGAVIPQDGKFSITTSYLPQGRYVIAGQGLKPYGLGKGGTQMLARRGSKKILTITIREKERRKVINLGALYLPVPKKK